MARSGDAFTEEDWAHSIGGVHVLLMEGDELVSHASVVERSLHVGQHRLRAGYVEAVATRPDRRRRGHASMVMGEVAELIRSTYELGALSATVPAMYERLGWNLYADSRPRGEDARGRRRRPSPDHSRDAGARPHRPDQLRVASRRSLVSRGRTQGARWRKMGG